jgi:cell division protein ZapA (FtsZ GTPase activity inhibitor)
MPTLETLILGQNYTFSCADDEYDLLKEAIQQVNIKLSHIREKFNIRSRENISILALVAIMVDTLKQAKEVAEIQPFCEIEENIAIRTITNPEPIDTTPERHDLNAAIIALQHRIDVALFN